jgi:hypothetical protein
MRDRCDLNTHAECSCIASNVPCKVQTYQILEEANTGAAKHGSACLILLSIIVFAIVVGLGAQVAPAAI